ncbi:MAG: hypothetical protein J6X44_13830, partial [Thermoguttaceae bacterium]|nr:hypothetical protein [Thermoguttaceae bacterium]
FDIENDAILRVARNSAGSCFFLTIANNTLQRSEGGAATIARKNAVAKAYMQDKDAFADAFNFFFTAETGR